MFLSNPKASFKTPEQAEALEVAINRQEHLLLIGPTAMGKSLVYMLPAATYDRTLVTLVLLPLSSLHQDFQRRCQASNISSSRWEPGLPSPPHTSIVYVSPEHAQRKEFSDYATGLYLTKKLARFVIDEPHLAVQHADFRYCFASLKSLISARKSLVVLGMLNTLTALNCRGAIPAVDRHLPPNSDDRNADDTRDSQMSCHSRLDGSPRDILQRQEVQFVFRS